MYFDAWFRLSLKHVAEGGNFAQEVISTIRTAQAFGTQRILSSIFGEHVDKSLRVGMKGLIYPAASYTVIYFVVYAGYGLGEARLRIMVKNSFRIVQLKISAPR